MKRLIKIFLICAFIYPSPVKALSLITDSEIDNKLRSWINPILEAGNIIPEETEIYVIHDPTINAFVTNGQKIFIHSGLILDTESLDQLLGVIAHEAAHISSGDLVRIQDFLNNASLRQMLITLIGLAGSIAAGSGDAAVGSTILAQHVGRRSFLSDIRSIEASADKLAIKYLKKIDRSAEGLLGFLKKIHSSSPITDSQISPYELTHPIDAERIKFVQENINLAKNKGQKASLSEQDDFLRLKAKLLAFTKNIEYVKLAYPQTDDSSHAKYARAILEFRQNDISSALATLDELLLIEPENPYLYELKGHMLFDNSRLIEAQKNYLKALSLAPEEHIMRVDLAKTLIAMNTLKSNKSAQFHLRSALNKNPNDDNAWHLLSIAYGRNKDKGLSALAQAERMLILKQDELALEQAKRAQNMLAKNSSEYQRAADIVFIIEQK